MPIGATIKTSLILTSLLTLPAILQGQTAAHVAAPAGRPMSAACYQLGEQLHWRICLEEPPVLSDAELGDEVVSAAGLRLRFRRSAPLLFDASAEAEPTTRAAKQEVMRGLLAAYNQTAASTYRFFIDGDMIHVVPDKVLGPDGEVHPYTSLLDTPVSIERGSYTLDSLVSAILTQIGSRRGGTVVVGTVPTNVFYQTRITEESQGETARAVLMRAFEEINGSRLAMHFDRLRLTWSILYDTVGKEFFFNVGATPPETEPEAPKPQFYRAKPRSPTDR